MIEKGAVLVLSAPCPATWPPAFEEHVAGRLPENVRSHVQAWKGQVNRIQAYTARLLLLQGLAIMKGSSSLEAWAVDGNGRPFLKDSGLDFNLSHSDGIAVCAMTARGRVGIDVEATGRMNPREFESLFTKDEMDEVCASPDPSAVFLRLWTSYEARLKAEGCGFLSKQPVFTKEWIVSPVELGPGYCCQVACDHPSVVTLLSGKRPELDFESGCG
jgi:4'-phosphopantetheinyl transferase